MRRAALTVARLASSSGACASEGAVTQAVWQLPISTGSSTQQQRSFAAGPKELPPTVANPLQQIVPPIISGFKAAVEGVSSGSKALVDAILTSSATRSAVHAYADKVILSGDVLALSDVDVAKWAVWLSDNAYTNAQGWATIKQGLAARLAAGTLSPAEVEAVVVALHNSRNYDRDLYEGFAKVVKERFMEFDTVGLCRLIAIYSEHDHFDQDLWDDVADSITYCNHYMAPMNCSLSEIAAVYASYARYKVDRGDLFVALARCIYDLKLKALDDKELGQVVSSLFRSWSALNFWPEATEPMLLEAKLRPAGFGGGEQTLVAEVEQKMRAASGGTLSWVDGGYQEEHYHGKPFGDYNLWVARDELFPQYYRPSDVKALKQLQG